MPLRILLVGDAGPERPGLETLLLQEAFEIVGRAPRTAGAGDLAQRLQPDVAILDADLPPGEPIAALHDIVAACPSAAVVAVGAEMSRHQIVAAFRAGLHGYVARSRLASDLVRAVRVAAHGGVFLSPFASRAVVERYL